MVNSQIKLSDAVKVILRDHQEGLSPQQIRDIIKQKYPFLYNTESNQRNVDKGHYKSLDHALLASIYTLSKSSPSINVDKSVKPMILTLEDGENSIVDSGDDIENEDIVLLESGVGTLYILGTNTYTKGGEEIVKIGITTGSVDSRINQLYTTGVPFKFRLIKQYSTTEYFKVEKILHLILDKYRTSKSREFFADGCLQHIENILAIINDAKK